MEVWKSEAVFQKHEIAAFRNCFCKLKNANIISNTTQALGTLDFLYRCNFSNVVENVFVATDAEVNDEDLNRKCTKFAASGNKKRPLIEEEGEESDEESDSNFAIGVELVEADHSFRPLYLKSIWIEPRTMTKRVSLTIFSQMEWNVEGFLLVLSRGISLWS